MTKSELFELTKTLRRTFPRVVPVLDLCDEAERLVLAGEPVRRGPQRDRAAYMRDWRKKLKCGADGAARNLGASDG